MTGSIFDFASRTCASTTVPRELALGAGYDSRLDGYIILGGDGNSRGAK